jgi:hypothetical protein
VEQALAERHLPRILDRRKWERRDRLLIGAGLRGRRLRDRAPCDAKCQDDQDQARYATSGSGDVRRQSQAVTRGWHGQPIIQGPDKRRRSSGDGRHRRPRSHPATVISNDYTDNTSERRLRGLSDRSFDPQSLQRLRTSTNRWERAASECTQCFKRNAIPGR